MLICNYQQQSDDNERNQWRSIYCSSLRDNWKQNQIEIKSIIIVKSRIINLWTPVYWTPLGIGLKLCKNWLDSYLFFSPNAFPSFHWRRSKKEICSWAESPSTLFDAHPIQMCVLIELGVCCTMERAFPWVSFKSIHRSDKCKIDSLLHFSPTSIRNRRHQRWLQ